MWHSKGFIDPNAEAEKVSGMRSQLQVDCALTVVNSPEILLNASSMLMGLSRKRARDEKLTVLGNGENFADNFYCTIFLSRLMKCTFLRQPHIQLPSECALSKYSYFNGFLSSVRQSFWASTRLLKALIAIRPAIRLQSR
jgi:hypothetical protein